MMTLNNRSEYQKYYYLKNKLLRKKYFKSKYKKNRKQRIAKSIEYYYNNQERILAMAKLNVMQFSGRINAIYSCVRKYAKRWKLPISTMPQFKEWSCKDEQYEIAYKAWKESGYNKYESPVVIRKFKKLGFVVDNLEWKQKKDFSWWSEAQDLRETVEMEVDKQQRERNSRTPEWRAMVRKQMKENKNRRLGK